nr:TolC family protein [uncultured Duganella sp.]
MSSPISARSHTRSKCLRIMSRTTLLLSLLVSGIEAIAAPQPLTLTQAQQQAVARSRQLTAQDLAIAGSREMAVAASQLPDPVLKAGIDNLPVSGGDRYSLGNDFMTMRRIGISQELTRADKRQWRSARFESEALKSEAQKEVVLAAIQRDTAIAWLERYYTEQMAALITSQANQAQHEIDAAAAAYRGGRSTQAEILAARSALLLLGDRASEINRRLHVAQTMLTRWTGASEDLVLEGAPDIDNIRLDPATLDTALAHHPKVGVLDRQEEVARAEANLARANQRADWSVEVAFQKRGSSYSNMISVGISVPLQWDRKNRQDRELAAKLAMVEQTTAERDEMLRDHVAETRTMIVDWQSGKERVARYERELIPLAGERTLAILASYRGGKATLTDVLAARRNETEVRLQGIQLQMDTARVWAQLNFLFPDSGNAQHSAIKNNKDSK